MPIFREFAVLVPISCPSSAFPICHSQTPSGSAALCLPFPFTILVYRSRFRFRSTPFAVSICRSRTSFRLEFRTANGVISCKGPEWLWKSNSARFPCPSGAFLVCCSRTPSKPVPLRSKFAVPGHRPRPVPFRLECRARVLPVPPRLRPPFPDPLGTLPSWASFPARCPQTTGPCIGDAPLMRLRSHWKASLVVYVRQRCCRTPCLVRIHIYCSCQHYTALNPCQLPVQE